MRMKKFPNIELLKERERERFRTQEGESIERECVCEQKILIERERTKDRKTESTEEDRLPGEPVIEERK